MGGESFSYGLLRPLLPRSITPGESAHGSGPAAAANPSASRRFKKNCGEIAPSSGRHDPKCGICFREGSG
jgi:hypothetical protein